MLNTRKRPFLFVFPLICLGISIATFSLKSSLLMLLLVVAALWLWAERIDAKSSQYLFCLLILLAGLWLGTLSRSASPLGGDSLSLTGVVLTTRELTNYQRTLVSIPQIQRKLALHLPLDISIRPGEWLEFTGSVEIPTMASNPGEFCYYSYLYSQGVSGFIEPIQVQHTKRISHGRYRVDKIRSYIGENISKYTTNHNLLIALVLGDRQGLDASMRGVWTSLGINHLLAISGMHIGLLASLLFFVLRPIPCRDQIRLGVIGLALLLYVLISGGRPSAWRAWLAVLVVLVGSKKAHIDSLHVWSLVGTTMVLLSPTLVHQIGFQLSFAASGGIVLWAPCIHRFGKLMPSTLFGRIGNFVGSSVFVSIIAQLSVAPLLANYFQQVSLMAPLATLLVLPGIFLLLLGGIALGLLGPIVAPIASLLDKVVIILDSLARWLSAYSVVIPIAPFRLDQLIMWYVGLIGLGYILRANYLFSGQLRYIRFCICSLALVAFLSIPPFIGSPLEVTVIYVGQGDAIYIRTPYNQHILVDGGGDSVYWQLRGRNVGLQCLLPYLEYRGVDQLDLVILTHPHEDHLHGLLAVLEHIPIKKIVDNGETHTTISYGRYLSLIEEKNIPYQRVQDGDTLILRGNIVLEIIHPNHLLTGTSSDLNNNSVVFQLQYQGRSMLFTGDLDYQGQQDLLMRHQPTVDWIKVPHHGSRAAWSSQFYDTVGAIYGVISVGRNSFGHPHPQVLAGLADMGVEVYRTDQDGAVSFYIWNGWLGPRLFSR